MIWRHSCCVWLTVLLSAFLVSAAGCGGGGDEDDSGDGSASAAPADSGAAGDENVPALTPTANSGDSPFNPEGAANNQRRAPANPQVLFKTSHGDILVQLDAGKAPITVDNFLSNYVNRGFYENTIFHYVEPASMIVGGGYDTQYQLKETRAEIQSEADNGLSNVKGTIAMARAADFAHSGTSQFFFNLKDNTQFDHQSRESAETYGYCVFGKVVQGHDVLDRIAATPTKESEISPKLPAEPVVIKSIEVVQ